MYVLLPSVPSAQLDLPLLCLFFRLLSAFHAGVDEITLAAHPGSAGLSEGAVEIHSFLDPMKSKQRCKFWLLPKMTAPAPKAKVGTFALLGADGGDDVLMTQLSVNAQQAFLHYTNATSKMSCDEAR